MDERYARQGKRNRVFEKRGKGKKKEKKHICLTKKERDWKKGKNCGAHGVSD